MLININITNFASIKDTQNISFAHNVISQETFKKNSLKKIPSASKKYLQILNSSFICANNALGKSNIINSLKYLQLQILNSYQLDFNLNYSDHAFKNTNDPIKISIDFFKKIKDKEYLITYELNQFKNNEIHELLSYKDIKATTLGKEIILFQKKGSKIIALHNNLRKVFKKVKYGDFTNVSILSIINNSNVFSKDFEKDGYLFLKNTYDFITQDLVFFNSLDQEVKLVDVHLKDKVLFELKKVNVEIKDFILKKVNDCLEIDVRHKVNGKLLILNFDLEANAIKKFIRMLIVLFENKNRVFFFDDFMNDLDYEMQKHIILLCKKLKVQVLYTTANPFFLDPVYFAKEQIYFLSKNTFSSSIFCLKDFENISYQNHNWSKLYVDGRFLKGVV